MSEDLNDPADICYYFDQGINHSFDGFECNDDQDGLFFPNYASMDILDINDPDIGTQQLAMDSATSTNVSSCNSVSDYNHVFQPACIQPPSMFQSQYPQGLDINLNYQPCSTWFESNSNQQSQSSGGRRTPKRKVALLDVSQEFKNSFYSIYTNRKKFEKKFVKSIHDDYLIKKINNLKKMSREEYRRIDLYFQNYTPYKDQILQVLRDNKDEITSLFLSDIKQKTD